MSTITLPSNSSTSTTTAMAAAVKDPSLYELFGSAGLHPVMIVLVAIRWLPTVVGQCFNVALIYVTIRNRNLHGTCNLFIATEALFESLTMSGFSISLYLALTGQNFITLGQCFPILAYAAFANVVRKLSLYLVSLDRLLAVCFPMIFGQKPHMYFGICMSAACTYGAVVLAMEWQACFSHDYVSKNVTCTVSDVSDTGAVGTFVLVNSITIVALGTLNYVVLWLVLRYKTSDGTEQGRSTRQFTRQIYRTLCVIAALAFVGWLLNPAIRLFTKSYLDLTVLQNFYVSAMLSTVSNSAMSLNVPVLYWFSKDYRNAFRKSFGFVLGTPQETFTKVVALHRGKQQQQQLANSRIGSRAQTVF